MARSVRINFNDREFSRTLREYSRLSKRSIPVICNTKAYYIARRATVETPAVDAKEIRAFINQDGGAVIARIINKRRGSRGEPGLFGAAMKEAIAIVRAARLRTRAFLKSGWIWSIKKLEPYAEKSGAPRQDRKAKTFGVAKGDAIPAREGFRVVSKIINTAAAAWDKREGAQKIAEPALARAFDFERRSMIAYMEKKLKQAAERAGIKMR